MKMLLSEAVGEAEGKSLEFLFFLLLGAAIVIFAERGEVGLPRGSDGEAVAYDKFHTCLITCLETLVVTIVCVIVLEKTPRLSIAVGIFLTLFAREVVFHIDATEWHDGKAFSNVQTDGEIQRNLGIVDVHAVFDTIIVSS